MGWFPSFGLASGKSAVSGCKWALCCYVGTCCVRVGVRVCCVGVQTLCVGGADVLCVRWGTNVLCWGADLGSACVGARCAPEPARSRGGRPRGELRPAAASGAGAGGGHPAPARRAPRRRDPTSGREGEPPPPSPGAAPRPRSLFPAPGAAAGATRACGRRYRRVPTPSLGVDRPRQVVFQNGRARPLPLPGWAWCGQIHFRVGRGLGVRSSGLDGSPKAFSGVGGIRRLSSGGRTRREPLPEWAWRAPARPRVAALGAARGQAMLRACGAAVGPRLLRAALGLGPGPGRAASGARGQRWLQPEGHDTGVKVYNSLTRRKDPLIVGSADAVSW